MKKYDSTFGSISNGTLHPQQFCDCLRSHCGLDYSNLNNVIALILSSRDYVKIKYGVGILEDSSCSTTKHKKRKVNKTSSARKSSYGLMVNESNYSFFLSMLQGNVVTTTFLLSYTVISLLKVSFFRLLLGFRSSISTASSSSFKSKPLDIGYEDAESTRRQYFKYSIGLFTTTRSGSHNADKIEICQVAFMEIYGISKHTLEKMQKELLTVSNFIFLHDNNDNNHTFLLLQQMFTGGKNW